MLKYEIYLIFDEWWGETIVFNKICAPNSPSFFLRAHFRLCHGEISIYMNCQENFSYVK